MFRRLHGDAEFLHERADFRLIVLPCTHGINLKAAKSFGTIFSENRAGAVWRRPVFRASELKIKGGRSHDDIAPDIPNNEAC
jgi:hypothetical protein